MLENPPTPYNFSRAGQLSKEQMRAVSGVNDAFSRSLTDNLGVWLRTEFEVSSFSTQQESYADFLARMPELVSLFSLRLEPLGALAVLQMDLALAMPIIDMLLGGPGYGTSHNAPLRELTDIEEAVLRSVLEIAVRELNHAWSAVGLHIALEKRESRGNGTRVMPGNEKTVGCSFEITIPGATGQMQIALPSVVLHTLLRQRINEERPRRRSPETRARMAELMGEATFGAVMQFPAVRLQAREISELAVGKVLRLPLPKHAPAELRVGGLTLFRAHPVQQGEHRGAQLGAAIERVEYTENLATYGKLRTQKELEA